MLNSPFNFKGNEYITAPINPGQCANNFTYEFIISPHYIAEKKFKAYLVSPEVNTEGNGAVVGILFENNIISIIEKYRNETEKILSIPFNNKEWIKIVLVYIDKVPTVYINEKILATGKKSKYPNIFPSLKIGGNEKGQCFYGKIQSIKFFKKGLNQANIRLLKDNKLDEHIEWGYDFLKKTFYRKGKKLDIKVSVILPTFNKYQDIILTLTSLDCQLFNKENFEVIVVDDGSTDQTPFIINHNLFSLNFKYIRSNKNIGRPSVRNLGIQNASGEIIVFLDAEIIVKSDFISQHYRAHMEKKNIVVCGSMVLRGLYTTFHPEFNNNQKSHMEMLMKNTLPYPTNTLESIRKGRKVRLITEKEIYNESYHHISFEKPFVKVYKQTLFDNYGNDLKGFHFPWILFCTGNVSIKAEAIKEVGLFEEYPGYGWDDHELGYRLFKKGYTFLNHIGLEAYHQEHPIAKSNPKEANKNFVRVFNKYPEIQLRIFALNFLRISVPNLHLIYESYLRFLEVYGNKYSYILIIFNQMLQDIANKLWNGEKLINFLSNLPLNKKTKLINQLEELKKDPRVAFFATNFINIIKS
ncbi:glycosyltransferase [Cytobacillus sp. BC1816]|uniref:glycosyltransferase n=1 Tax=Cytobacillus sp. BC1816 TaxID=3440154 RepID=UPI003F516B31